MKTIAIAAILLGLIACQTDKHQKINTQKTTTVQQVKTQQNTKVEQAKDSKIVSNNPNGEYLELYANGKIKIEGQNKNGKRDGVWYSYFENGNKWSETNYKEGIKEGATLVNHPNGKLFYKGVYKNDKKSGTWYFYKKDGSLDYEENY